VGKKKAGRSWLETGRGPVVARVERIKKKVARRRKINGKKRRK